MTGACPKHLVMGPCGGVRADGHCEVIPEPCVFPAPAQWAEPVPAVPLRAVPLILTDFSSEPYSVRMLSIAAAAREARAMLGIPGVAGVNISGAASARGYEFAARVKAELAVRIREERDHDPLRRRPDGGRVRHRGRVDR
jgi:methylene-tetrahydrofolate reductase-like protein